MHHLIEYAHAEADLVRGHPQELTLQEARQLHLGAWAYYTAPSDLPWRSQAAEDFANAWQRYRVVAKRSAELFRIWEQAGIEVLLYKGIAMATYVYPHPALRFFGDVDVLIDERQLEEAVALASGWRILRTRPHHTNAYVSIVDPIQHVNIDLHISLAPGLSCSARESRRLTEATKRRATRVVYEGVPVLLPCAADLVLVGLAMNRGWSRDRWRPKTHDYLDIHYAGQRMGLSGADIEARAQQLGLSTTWRIYSRNCNPLARRLRLVTPRLSRSLKWSAELAILQERFSPMVRVQAVRIARLLEILTLIPRTLMELSSVLLMLRKQVPPSAIVQVGTRRKASGVSHDRVTHATVVVVRLLDTFLKRQPAGICVIRSATLFRTMTAFGHEVEWVFGFRKTAAGTAEGHAWVERDRVPLPAFDDHLAPLLYVETLRQGLQPAAPVQSNGQLERIQRSLKSRLYRLEDARFERRHGFQFQGIIAHEHLKADKPISLAHATAYQPIPCWVLRKFFEEAAKTGRVFQSFVDIGSGKGKACLYAALRARFKTVLGIEFSRELIDIAERNREKCGASTVQFLNEDAMDFVLPAGNSLVFIYNPFDEIVLERFVTNNLEHFRQYGSVIAYANDFHREALARLGFASVYRSEISRLSLHEHSVF